MHRRLNIALGLALLGTLIAGCRTPIICEERPDAAIRAALNRQVQEWNKGNLPGFMSIYARSEQTRFASGGDISMGWQTVFDRYQRRYGTGASMGTLSFSDLEITPLGEDAALAFGHWHLKRGDEISSGLFTLLFRTTPDGWRIVHDHTSSATK
jgi:beta-aspartyl-peptidase (threonine type)